MNRAEFMRRLTELLGDVSPMERDEAIQYYNDYFDDAGAENEGGVIASLGTPEELARTIKAGLNDGGNAGEFTESGFSGYTQAHRDEIMKTGETAGSAGASGNTGKEQDINRNAAAGNGAQAKSAYYQGAYYQRSGSDRVYGGREDTRRHENPYERTNTGNTANQGNGNFAGSTAGGGYEQPKKDMSGGTIAAIVIPGFGRRIDRSCGCAPDYGICAVIHSAGGRYMRTGRRADRVCLRACVRVADGVNGGDCNTGVYQRRCFPV